jgi:putative tryptophan/tyrosine transport system substrate-binding protein
VDVILALDGSAVARAAKHATRTVPVVMVGVPNVVELGLVESLARPGGNLTGMTLPFAELVTKHLELRNHREAEAVLGALSPSKASGLLVLTDRAFSMARIPLLAINHRLPTIYLRREFAVAGGLMSYGPSLAETYRRAAFYVGRLLKGVKPADLPVEQPTRFELIINLTTAKALGLTIPPTLLFQADEVIR